MTKVHVIDRNNISSYREVLYRYYKLRHEIFVGERNWKLPGRSDGLEIDAYDDENAIYLIALDGERVVGGQRLYPTVLPHMISEVFPYLVSASGVPQGPNIFEWTRYFVVKERRTGRTDCRMLAALQQFCLEAGISQVTAVVEMWWLPRWQQAGFTVHPLGLQMIVEGQPTIAVAVDISVESMEAVQEIAGLRGPVLVREDLATRLSAMVTVPTTAGEIRDPASHAIDRLAAV